MAPGRLIAAILSHQDPDQPHTMLTRVTVAAIIVFASLVYAGFFGILAAIAMYLVGVELWRWPLAWAYAPILIALVAGFTSGCRGAADYWRNYAHGARD